MLIPAAQWCATLPQDILTRADSDNQFVDTVKQNLRGVDTVYITIRKEAEKRGEEIFP